MQCSGLAKPSGSCCAGLLIKLTPKGLVFSFLFFCCTANDGQVACCVQKLNSFEEVLMLTSFMEVFVLLCTRSQTALHPVCRDQSGLILHEVLYHHLCQMQHELTVEYLVQ